jgi:hypothetical protein
MLKEMDWRPEGIPSAEWKFASLNRLFLEQGATGKPGCITTVRHGERDERDKSVAPGPKPSGQAGRD